MVIWFYKSDPWTHCSHYYGWCVVNIRIYIPLARCIWTLIGVCQVSRGVDRAAVPGGIGQALLCGALSKSQADTSAGDV